MIGVFSAEWLKLRKRAATYVIGAIWVALILLLEYLLSYYFSKSASRPRNGGGFNARALIDALLPRNIVHYRVPGNTTLGGALVLILAALIGGSEFGWSTLKTIFTQRPTRLTVFAGKLLALLLLLVIFVVLAFVAAGVGSLIVAASEHATVVWPPLGDILKGAGAMLLVFAAWAAVGLGLAVLFQGTALAIGIGLVYALVVESLINVFAARNDVVKTISNGLLGTNASALVDPFRASFGGFRASASPPVGVGQAAITLGVYVVVFVLLAAILLRQRDVT